MSLQKLFRLFSLYIVQFGISLSVIVSMVEWLERHDYDRRGPGKKPIRTILLCPWESYFAALFSAW